MLDRHAFNGMPSVFRSRQILAQEGEALRRMLLLQQGWACRYQLLPDGRRQIVALYLPGDWCGFGGMLGGANGQPLMALTTGRVLAVDPAEIRRLCDTDDDQRLILLKEMMAAFERQAQWLVNLGRKSAIERLCHFFCELFDRLQARRLTLGRQFALPLTQIDLADVIGLTPVHVNRMLRELRQRRLVALEAKWVRLGDLAELRRIALCDAGSERAGDELPYGFAVAG